MPNMHFGNGALVAVFCGALLIGCGKKEVATETAPAAGAVPVAGASAKDALPGTSQVRESLAKKDYDSAVGGLLILKQAVTTEAQREEYNAVLQEARDLFIENSLTDKKAAEALAQLGSMR